MFYPQAQAKAWFKSAAICWLACASAPLAMGADAVVTSDAAAKNAALPLSFHRLFSDHRVLQRDVAVPVYGHAKPGSKLSLRLGGVTQETIVGADGSWQVELPPFPSGGPHRLEAICNGQVATLDDILFGDVWIASGQSNMEWKVGGGVLDKEQEIASANFPKIRFFNVPSRLSDVPETDLADGRWQVASPETVSDCSAVAWFFARRVFQETGVPIGIIGCSVGGTPVEAWMSATAMQRFPNPKQAMLDELNAKHGSWTRYLEENQRNIQQMFDQVNSSMQAVSAGVLRRDFDDSLWTDGGLLTDPPPKNCLRWWRRKLTLTPDQAAAPLVLSLARPADKALVFVNGNKVADVSDSDCRVELPAGTFHTGENLIVVRLGNYWVPPARGRRCRAGVSPHYRRLVFPANPDGMEILRHHGAAAHEVAAHG
jgi:sialate O-acetylesterase